MVAAVVALATVGTALAAAVPEWVALVAEGATLVAADVALAAVGTALAAAAGASAEEGAWGGCAGTVAVLNASVTANGSRNAGTVRRIAFKAGLRTGRISLSWRPITTPDGPILCRESVIRLTLQRLKPRIAGLYRSGPYCTLGRKQ